MAKAFAGEGFDIVLSDIDKTKLEESAAAVRERGADVMTVQADVADPAAMLALAEAAYDRFGVINRLCLNAGLAILKPFELLTREDWDKVLSVQLGGVLNGVLAFLPRLIAQGAGDQLRDRDRHILIVSSMSGVGRADLRVLNAPYVVAKFASAGLAEVMSPALEPHGIAVSVLCPGMTVADPAAMQGVEWPMPSASWYADNLLDADQVASEVLLGIAERRLHIFPHRAGKQEVMDRHARLLQGFEQAERSSPALSITLPRPERTSETPAS